MQRRASTWSEKDIRLQDKEENRNKGAVAAVIFHGIKKHTKVGEFVIASVSKISKFGAYCRLPEYNDLEVFLP